MLCECFCVNCIIVRERQTDRERKKERKRGTELERQRKIIVFFEKVKVFFGD